MNRAYAKSPAEVAAKHREFLEDLAGGKLRSLSFGIPAVDAVVKRLYPGRMLTIVARPSHMKTTLLTHLARVECMRLLAEGDEQHYVLFVSLEESEGQVLCWVSNELPNPEGADPSTYAAALTRAARWPLWVVGREPVPTLESVSLDSLPRLTAEQVLREIQVIAEKTGKRPSAIFLDYLQILDIEAGHDQRNMQISAALQVLKRIAKHVNAPLVMAAQAKEEVDLLPMPIPKAGHAYYSSEVLHVSDVLMSLYYPWRNERCHETGEAKLPGRTYRLSQNLLWLQLLKQRHGEGHFGWPIYVDPVTRLIRGIYDERA